MSGKHSCISSGQRFKSTFENAHWRKEENCNDYGDDDEKGEVDENDLESESGLFPRDWTLRRSWKLLPLNLLSFVGEAAHGGGL